MPVKPVTKEEVLIQDGIYNDLVNFRPVYIKNVVDSMETYAALQTEERDERIEELTNLLYDQWWRRHKEAGISETDIQIAWQQFKTKYHL